MNDFLSAHKLFEMFQSYSRIGSTRGAAQIPSAILPKLLIKSAAFAIETEDLPSRSRHLTP